MSSRHAQQQAADGAKDLLRISKSEPKDVTLGIAALGRKSRWSLFMKEGSGFLGFYMVFLHKQLGFSLFLLCERFFFQFVFLLVFVFNVFFFVFSVFVGFS